MKDKSTVGLILLIINTLPLDENPPNPTILEGTKQIEEVLVESLIDHWDYMVLHDVTIPLLLVSSCHFDDAVARALGHPVSKKYREDLLKWLKIPISNSTETEDMPFLFSIGELRRQFLDWIGGHALEVVMVKPFMNVGAKLNRKFSLSATRSGDQDSRPLALEVVPFDGKGGPILGLFTGVGGPRPVVMPTADWRRDKYCPQARDFRATGTVYVDLPSIRLEAQGRSEDGLSPIVQWSMKPLLSIAESSWHHESVVFEEALRDLLLLLKARPIICPPERGLRGFFCSSHPR